MEAGKEKGFVLYDEVNELLAEDFPFRPRVRRSAHRSRQRRRRDPGRAQARLRERRTSRTTSRDLELAQDVGDKTNDPGAHVPARDGHRPAAHARRRNRASQAQRARPMGGSQGALPFAAGDPRDHPIGRGSAARRRFRPRRPGAARIRHHRRGFHRATERSAGARSPKSRSITRRASSSGRSCKPSRGR